MILDRNHPADATYDENVVGQTQLFPYVPTFLGPRGKSLGINTVIDHAEPLSRHPRLLPVKASQVFRDRKQRVTESIESAPQQPTAIRKAPKHVQFIAVLAVNDHGYACKSCCWNRFNCAPVAGVYDVGSVGPHNSGQPENGKLKTWSFLSRNQHAVRQLLLIDEIGIIATCRADPMRKDAVSQARHYFQQTQFRAAHV